MTNVNAPFGLRPHRQITGAPFSGQINEYEMASGETNNTFIGDAVVTTGDSNTVDGTPQVGLANDNSGAGITSDIRGAVVGVRPTLTNLTLNYRAASVTTKVLVADDPNTLFLIQSDGTLAHGDISGSAKMINGTGSTVTGISGGLLHESTVGQSHYGLKIIRLLPVASNAFGSKGIVEVMINLHELRDTSGDT